MNVNEKSIGTDFKYNYRLDNSQESGHEIKKIFYIKQIQNHWEK